MRPFSTDRHARPSSTVRGPVRSASRTAVSTRLPGSPHRRPRALLAGVAVAGLVVLGGCTGQGDNTVAGQAQEVADRAYVSGDGRIEKLAADERGEPVDLTGTTLDGTTWSSADHRGKIVVLNVWGSWCPPCVAEMPELQKAHETLEKSNKPVEFMGVDINESPETAAAFMKRVGTTYPSLRDDGGAALIALQDKASTPPATLLLDKQGRIAARVTGETTAATVTGLVDDVLAEG